MDKIKLQEEYFEKVKELFKKHSDLPEDKFYNYVYTELIRLNISNYDKTTLLSYEFTDWSRDFKDSKNIRAFYDMHHETFYQFKNRYDELKTKTAIKLYIPMDTDHIYEGVKQLFTYIDNEDIPNASKIRNKITMDNVVIRVNTIEEAEKIINYVNNNEYIKEGLIEPNPFLISKDNIGMALDGNTTSYNGVLSRYITEYIYKNKDNIDNINISNFKDYLELISKDNMGIKAEEEKIIQLALKSVNDNSNNYDNFKDHVKRVKTIYDIDRKEILDNALRVLIDKYGSKQAEDSLREYIKTGNINKFSRDENTRQEIVDYLTPKIAMGTVLGAVATREGKKEEKDVFERYILELGIKLGLEESKINILEEVSKLTVRKHYDIPNQLRVALLEYINNGNLRYFSTSVTNEQKSRVDIGRNIKPEEVENLLRIYLNKNGIDTNNMYLDDVVNEFNDDIRKRIEKEINPPTYEFG